MKRARSTALDVPLLVAPLPAPLCAAWQRLMAAAGDIDSPAHWWKEPHWVPRRAVAEPSLLGCTVTHILDELQRRGEAPEFAGVEFWSQRREISADLQ